MKYLRNMVKNNEVSKFNADEFIYFINSTGNKVHGVLGVFSLIYHFIRFSHSYSLFNTTYHFCLKNYLLQNSLFFKHGISSLSFYPSKKSLFSL